MLAALLLIAGTWTWNASPTADGYQFCWSYDNQEWSLALCVDVGPSLAYLPSIELDLLWAIESTPGAILFFQVLAYNAAGFDEVGQTFTPVPPDWLCQGCLP